MLRTCLRRSRLLCLVCLFAAGAVPVRGTAAEEISVEEVLVLPVPGNLIRRPVPIDPIEYMIVTGTWSAPAAGTTVAFTQDAAGTWKNIRSGENGWFEHDALRGGYAYAVVDLAEAATLILHAMGHDLVYVNGVPRAGNRYQFKDKWESWEPRFDYARLPVDLRAGKNELLFYSTRSGRLKIRLYRPAAPVMFNLEDVTLPDYRAGEDAAQWGAVVVVNGTRWPLKDCVITTSGKEWSTLRTPVPSIPPCSIRKVAFQMKGSAPGAAGERPLTVALTQKRDGGEIALDTAQLLLRCLPWDQPYRRTFISEIDGSVQYYAVNPAAGSAGNAPALFLSLHGAAVEAINQAGAYGAKRWGHLVAPTNRRPYGFNWEDWGRIDALEVLAIASATLAVDTDRIYLTGHSMGGHGTWHLGALYPDRFAAIGPSAGWISFWSYRVRDAIDDDSPMGNMLMRAALPSNTFALLENYRQHGVYVIHGGADDNVPADQSRMMMEQLAPLHDDVVYHEERGAGHWWDNSKEPGADCVDWAPLFDYFARHARPRKERIRRVAFKTPHPGISSWCNWVGIEDQTVPLKMSGVDIRYDPGLRRFSGTTRNVARLALTVPVPGFAGSVSAVIDSYAIDDIPVPLEAGTVWLSFGRGGWHAVAQPSPNRKGPHRYGTFKDAFRHRMQFVYGTRGSEAENRWARNRARLDAELFWYQGNGSVDLVPDSAFDAQAERDRNVILYGNASTNAAWKPLLNDAPLQVENGSLRLESREVRRNDLACLAIRPRPGSERACVGIVSGTGITGMRLTDRRRYLSPGYAFPDCIVYTPRMLVEGSAGVLAAGFFGSDWGVATGEFVWNE